MATRHQLGINATSSHINCCAVFSWPTTAHPLESYILDRFSLTGRLVRIPTTGDNSLDWRFSTTITPGTLVQPVTGL